MFAIQLLRFKEPIVSRSFAELPLEYSSSWSLEFSGVYTVARKDERITSHKGEAGSRTAYRHIADRYGKFLLLSNMSSNARRTFSKGVI